MKATRHRLLALAALATFALAAWTAAYERPEPVPVAPPTAAALSTGTGRAIGMPNQGKALDRDPLIDADDDPFRVVSFLPPQAAAPPAPPPLPPAKPTAPPFPFRYFGKMVDVNGNPVTYLARDDELIPIRVNDVLQDAYRIDAMDQNQIVVTYLPLNEKMTISIDSPPR